MGTALLATLLLRIVARTCLVCGHIAHKRQGESKVYVCRCCAVVDGCTNDEPLYCRAERYCGRAALSSRACFHSRCVLLLLRHGKDGEVQCHEEKGGGA